VSQTKALSEGQSTAIGVVAPRVVLAEDDPELRSALASVLGVAGFVVEPYATGSELGERLLGRLAESSARPDVVVTDICLPGCTGLEVLKALRHCKSGSLDPTVGTERPDLGAVAFLSKPFDLAAFLSTVRRLAKGRRQAGD
jgi:DNA-binding response OmpR family regulator